MTESARVPLLLLCLVILVAGCRDQQPTVTNSVGTVHTTEEATSSGGDFYIRGRPEVPVTYYRETRYRKMSDDVMFEAIQNGGNLVAIGFKNPAEAYSWRDDGNLFVRREAFLRGVEALEDLGLKVVEEFTFIPSVHVRIDEPTIELIGAIRDLPYVDHITPNSFPRFLGETVTWNIAEVDAPEAWQQISKAGQPGGGSGIILSFLDSGIDLEHDDLDVEHAWDERGEDELDDVCGHGTAVSGVAAALKNSYGIRGGSYAVRLWSQKINGLITLHRALNRAYRDGTDVLNVSLAWADKDQESIDALQALWNDGRVVVAAAGDQLVNAPGGYGFPARDPNTIAVTATDSTGALWSENPTYSSDQPPIELAAPGVDVVTTWCDDCDPQADECSELNDPGGGADEPDSPAIQGTTTGTGTSFSSPHVAATVALIWAYHPSYTNQQIRDRLHKSARDNGYPSDQVKYGLLDIDHALPLRVRIDGPTSYTEGTYTWEAIATGGGYGYSYNWTAEFDTGVVKSWGTGSSTTQTLNSGEGDFWLTVEGSSRFDNYQESIRVTEDVCTTCDPFEEPSD